MTRKIARNLSAESILIDEKKSVININSLEIVDYEGAQQLLPLSSTEREKIITNAITIGLRLIRNFQTVQEVNIIEENFKRFGESVEVLTANLSKEMQDYFGDKGILQTLFDPEKKTSIPRTLSDSLTGPDSSIQKLLDPRVEGSPIFRLRKELLEEGKNLRDKFSEFIGEERLRKVSTEKGFDFEDIVFETLEQSAKVYGDHLKKIGKKSGSRGKALAGDLLLEIYDSSLTSAPRVVIEAKSRKTQSLPDLQKQIKAAIENRNADWAIGVVENSSSLPKSVGHFRYYKPNVIICSFEDDGLALEVAYQFARTNILLDSFRKESVKVLNAEIVLDKLNEIKSNLSKIRDMKTNLTEINKSSDKVKSLLDDFRNDIKDSLKDLSGYIAECEA